VVEGRDKDNGRRSSFGSDQVVSGGVTFCGGLARWRLCALRGASLDDECLQKFREAFALKEIQSPCDFLKSLWGAASAAP
jgi:hypothetical protein